MAILRRDKASSDKPANHMYGVYITASVLLLLIAQFLQFAHAFVGCRDSGCLELAPHHRKHAVTLRPSWPAWEIYSLC